MSDLISREELIRVIDHRLTHTKDARKSHTSVFIDGMKDGYARIRSDVLLMPSAQPERKRKKWIDHEEYDEGKWIVHLGGKYVGFPCAHYECSECHAYMPDNTNFCPNCGADMRGEEDE